MNLTAYEKNQSFNSINSWLHSRRYRAITREFARLDLAKPIKVLDIGCAHAPLFPALDPYGVDYLGVEISTKMAGVAQSRYGHCPNFRILVESAMTVIDRETPDVVTALETLEHIPEHDVVRLIEKVAARKPKLFIASVPIEIGPTIWIKNVGSWLMRYPRYKEYTWAETFHAGLYRLDRLPPHDTGHKGFDWRWLAQTIRHNMDLRVITLPLPVLPACVSTSVFMIARPRAG
jgi:SAM-dependent methyltransferase